MRRNEATLPYVIFERSCGSGAERKGPLPSKSVHVVGVEVEAKFKHCQRDIGNFNYLVVIGANHGPAVLGVPNCRSITAGIPTQTWL